jgi:hypothetical protein
MSTKETICWGDYGPTMLRKSEVTLYEFAFVMWGISQLLLIPLMMFIVENSMHGTWRDSQAPS